MEQPTSGAAPKITVDPATGQAYVMLPVGGVAVDSTQPKKPDPAGFTGKVEPDFKSRALYVLLLVLGFVVATAVSLLVLGWLPGWISALIMALLPFAAAALWMPRITAKLFADWVELFRSRSDKHTDVEVLAERIYKKLAAFPLFPRLVITSIALFSIRNIVIAVIASPTVAIVLAGIAVVVVMVGYMPAQSRRDHLNVIYGDEAATHDGNHSFMVIPTLNQQLASQIVTKAEREAAEEAARLAGQSGPSSRDEKGEPV